MSILMFANKRKRQSIFCVGVSFCNHIVRDYVVLPRNPAIATKSIYRNEKAAQYSRSPWRYGRNMASESHDDERNRCPSAYPRCIEKSGNGSTRRRSVFARQENSATHLEGAGTNAHCRTFRYTDNKSQTDWGPRSIGGMRRCLQATHVTACDIGEVCNVACGCCKCRKS